MIIFDFNIENVKEIPVRSRQDLLQRILEKYNIQYSHHGIINENMIEYNTWDMNQSHFLLSHNNFFIFKNI